MELLDHLLLLGRWWRRLLAALLASAAAAGCLAVALPVEHLAAAQLFVGDAAPASAPGVEGRGSSQYVFDRMPSYAELVGSAVVTRALAERLARQPPGVADPDRTTAAVVPGTVLLEVTARADDARSAVELANVAAESLAGAVEELETPEGGTRSRVVVTVARPATVELSTSSPQRSDVVAGALLCGAAAGLLLVLAADQASRRRSAAPGTTDPATSVAPVDAGAAATAPSRRWRRTGVRRRRRAVDAGPRGAAQDASTTAEGRRAAGRPTPADAP